VNTTVSAKSYRPTLTQRASARERYAFSYWVVHYFFRPIRYSIASAWSSLTSSVIDLLK